MGLMSRVTCDLTISLDGFVAGPNQSPAIPLGEGGELLHRWMFEEPEANAAAIDGILASGAYIMGRNMFAGPDSGRGMRTGGVGGARSRRITHPYSCSPIMRASPWRCRAAPRSTS
ncbi:bifunctional deaminase-reductase domain protein [Arthrobacter sp. Hiyo4]|nr:bifunctional deaminase-reductase domain protein [Arthrobacter sp. Hiyo4]